MMMLLLRIYEGNGFLDFNIAFGAWGLDIYRIHDILWLIHHATPIPTPHLDTNPSLYVSLFTRMSLSVMLLTNDHGDNEE